MEETQRTSPSSLSVSEAERLQRLADFKISGGKKKEQLDSLAELAASIFAPRVVLITIAHDTFLFSKSNIDLTTAEKESCSAFSNYATVAGELLEIEDTVLDTRFPSNDIHIRGIRIRYYCAVPLKNHAGENLGSLAIIGQEPDKLSPEKRKSLILLAQQIADYLELDRQRKELQLKNKVLEDLVAERSRELDHKIIELHQRDEKITSINNELNRLIYKASHDLLGPLRTLEGLLNLAKNEQDVRRLHEYINHIYDTEQKLDLALVNLLKIVQIKDASDFTLIAWDMIILKAIDEARKRVPEKDIRLSLEHAATYDYHSDASLLEMVFEELLVNSMHFNKLAEASVLIHITVASDHVHIQFSDDGEGIREEDKSRIFEMFYRNPNSRGSGLGLYIVKTAVEKMNGRIVVNSTGNTGASFFISLPRMEKPSA